ncbi:hypothetical protein BC567DRAFT_21722 [Phyllosticta citribraziliensis]
MPWVARRDVLFLPFLLRFLLLLLPPIMAAATLLPSSFFFFFFFSFLLESTVANTPMSVCYEDDCLSPPHNLFLHVHSCELHQEGRRFIRLHCYLGQARPPTRQSSNCVLSSRQSLHHPNHDLTQSPHTTPMKSFRCRFRLSHVSRGYRIRKKKKKEKQKREKRRKGGEETKERGCFWLVVVSQGRYRRRMDGRTDRRCWIPSFFLLLLACFVHPV